MSKPLNCEPCYLRDRAIHPAAIKIDDEYMCIPAARSQGLDLSTGELLVRDTPAAPPGVPKVPNVPAPAPRKAAPVAEKKEIPMKLAPGEGKFCSTCNTRIRKDSPDGLCKACRVDAPNAPAELERRPAGRPGATKKAVRTSAPEPQPTPDMATISVPATFIQKYWASLTLTEQAQLVNQHMLEARA